MNLKLGLDIGVASVGWGIIDENYTVIDSGVRLFTESSADSNAIRRSMRSSRRRLRRLQHRLHRLEKILCRALEIEKPSFAGNVYEIRCRGLQEKLTKEELFVAIMHLGKRRGTHFLTAEDFIEPDQGGKSTEEILREQEKKLQGKFVCQIQYEKLLQDGKVRGIENRFGNKEYRRELVTLLKLQGEYYPAIRDNEDKILSLYDSKREYYEGPGGPNSPTPYGCFRYDDKGKIIEVNLIDLMRGTCTFFPDEKRIAYNSYTACLFNLLNDLNNMTAAGEPINYDQKKALVENVVNQGKNVTLQTIAKITGVKSQELRGYRIDKNEKPIFTEFVGYKAILSAVEKAGGQSDFVKGNREWVDHIADILTKEKSIERRLEELIRYGIEPAVAQELKKLAGFTKYHSLSQRAIELVLDDLWETNDNQMQLFYKLGIFRQDKIKLQGSNIPFDGSDWIVSPVTKRAVNETIKIINETRAWVRKKYNCEFTEIVIEMAREKNSQEKTDFIKKMQKQNEMIGQNIKTLVDTRRINAKQFEILKLLLEQDFRCAYSGESVGLAHVLEGCLEVDHIIPRSFSFDDSLANKVAVLVSENQKKGQDTPFQYLKTGRGKQSYEEFKSWVLNNENYRKHKKKRENLLYEGNPQDELTGFINRNLVDTRYACKEVLNLLQDYFQVNQIATKVSVVKGSFTHAFRKKAKLSKDRETTYAHHAQDALIVAGLANTRLFHKVHYLVQQNEDILDDDAAVSAERDTSVKGAAGESIIESDFDCSPYIRFIRAIEQLQPKYSHKVDRKPNRALYDQQVKSTREKDDKLFIITKYKDIYSKGANNSGEKLKKRLQENPESLLMYHYDRKTFDQFQQIVAEYSDSKNPFADYFADYGQPVRKYAKNGTGTFINDVKFYDRELGNHRKNVKQQGKNLSVYLGIKSLRADFYLDNGVYKFVSVPYDMLVNQDKAYVIDELRYGQAKQRKRISEAAEFLFSLHTGEMFSYEKDGKSFEWFYNCVNDDDASRIEAKFVDRPSPGKTQGQRRETIGKKISNLEKYHVDVLGNKYKVKQEPFVGRIEL
jgi:CRISPR-associated endonuclease Csn1